MSNLNTNTQLHTIMKAFEITPEDSPMERYILTSKYMNGDSYFNSFDSIFDLTSEIESIYNDWLSANGLDDANTVSPFCIQVEFDNPN